MILQSTIDWSMDKADPSYWKGSIFEEIRELSNDERGLWGEKLVYELISQHTDMSVYWDKNKNIKQHDGKYDLMINGHRVEVKTSFGGHSDNYQHENIYNDAYWDKIVMVDVDRDRVYFTCINRLDMTWTSRHPVLGRKPTLRDHQTDKYKWDFSSCVLTRGANAGLTTHWMVGDPDETTIPWWSEKFA